MMSVASSFVMGDGSSQRQQCTSHEKENFLQKLPNKATFWVGLIHWERWETRQTNQKTRQKHEREKMAAELLTWL